MTGKIRLHPLHKGMEMIYKQLTTVLEGVGVSPIEAGREGI